MTGTHIILDLFGCQDLDVGQWRSLLHGAVEAAGVELIKMEVKEFSPQGLTAFCLLSESHLSVHTWPEDDYIGIDLFTCGPNCQPESAIEVLLESLSPMKFHIKRLERGRSTLSTDDENSSSPSVLQQGANSQ